MAVTIRKISRQSKHDITLLSPSLPHRPDSRRTISFAQAPALYEDIEDDSIPAIDGKSNPSIPKEPSEPPTDSSVVESGSIISRVSLPLYLRVLRSLTMRKGSQVSASNREIVVGKCEKDSEAKTMTDRNEGVNQTHHVAKVQVT